MKNSQTAIAEGKSSALVSVVVPTLNAESLIGTCLESVRAQGYPNTEVIVIDGHSRDNTRDIAGRYGRVYAFGPDQSSGQVFGAPYQRNYGAQQATGEYVYWIDADMELTEGLLSACVKTIEEQQADAVIVPEESFGVGYWSNCKRLERMCYEGDDLVEAPRFIRKTAWDAVGGLDPQLGGFDDWDLHHRLRERGYKIVRVSNQVMHNEGKLRLLKRMRKKYIYGKTAYKYLAKRGGLPVKQFTPFRACYFKNWRRFVMDPIHTPGFVVLRGVEYLAGFAGWVVSKFHRDRIVLK